MNRRVPSILLLAFCVFALFWQLGSYGLTEPDEGRTAGIGYEFFESRTWLVPRLYDLAQFNKPPLVYWACSLAYRIGGVNEWTGRLPAALAALGTLLLTGAMARRFFGEQESIFAMLILLTAPMFFVMAHIIDPNMMLAFWITLTMWSAIAWFQDGRRYQQWIFWVGLGIAFLAKGPPAVAVVGLALAGFRFLPSETPDGVATNLRWRPLPNIPAILACIVIGLSWYVAVANKYPELWHFFFGQEIAGRLTGGKLGRSQPFYYFIPMLLGGFLVWLPLLIASVVGVAKDFKSDHRVRLLGCWVLLPFIMFSVVKSKLPAYILPLFPPMAILMAATAAKAQPRWLRLTLVPFATASAAGLVFVLAWRGRIDLGWDQTLEFRDAVWLVPAAISVAAIFIFSGSKKLVAAAAFVVVSFLVCLGMVARHDNELGAQSSAKKMCEVMRPLLRSSDRIAILKNSPRGVYFYLQRPLCFSDKYEAEIQSDWKRLADQLYKDDDVGVVYHWFDSEPRVFVITTDRKRGGEAGKDKSPLDFLKANCRKPVREVYRDDKYVVVCNFPQP